jgi:hypothetical protein
MASAHSPYGIGHQNGLVDVEMQHQKRWDRPSAYHGLNEKMADF